MCVGFQRGAKSQASGCTIGSGCSKSNVRVRVNRGGTCAHVCWGSEVPNNYESQHHRVWKTVAVQGSGFQGLSVGLSPGLWLKFHSQGPGLTGYTIEVSLWVGSV